MAVTEASLRSLLRNLSHFYVPFASQKMDGAVSIPAYTFIYNKRTASLPAYRSFLGGDGGNRNRVRKHIPATFYERSRLFKIPLSERRTAGFLTQ